MHAMNYREEAKQKINEMTTQINQLKIQVVDQSLKEQYQDLIRQLEQIRDRIQGNYEQMDDSSDDKEWSEFNSNIYTDLQSFDTAFKKAGAMFRPQP
jgi:predicted  nucleic acid-binding Zn-ribbon protein